jgi:methyl-accepting chemotaxis protein
MSFIDKLEQIEKNHKITMTRKINHLSIAGIIIGLLILLYFLNDVKYNVYKNESKALLLKLDDRLMLKRNVAISNVVALSNDMRIIEALKNNDKSKMKDVLSQLSKRYKDMTTFKNVKVHVHTKDNKSFFRSWKNKNGDDLSWRDTVVNVNRNHKTVIAFEVGKAGLTLKAVIPLFDENRRHIGSIEFIQGLNSVAKRFKKTDDAFILLMNKSQLQTAKFMKNPKSLQDFIVAQNFLDNDFYNDALSLDFDKLKKDNYYLGENYFYSYKDVTDTKDRVIGMMLVASKMDKIDKLIERSSFLILITIFMMFIATAILKVVLNFGIVKSFKKVVDLLSISSSKIENASIVLTKSSGDLSNMSASQSASVEEILATIEQTSENISNNFNNMLNLEKLGSQVESKANTGYEHMKELSASMNNISKSSKDINTIVNTIDEIAFQTNLLALNAAV